jgi:hypothetical protein
MSEVFVHKITLSTGKVVLLRDPKIKDQELATQAASSKVKGDNAFAYGFALQKEMLKMLLVQINDKKPSAVEVEDLDGLFTYAEFMQCLKVVAKVAGLEDTEMGNFKIELQKHGS